MSHLTAVCLTTPEDREPEGDFPTSGFSYLGIILLLELELDSFLEAARDSICHNKGANQPRGAPAHSRTCDSQGQRR